MFSFEYISPFWYQQEAQEPGFLIQKDRRGFDPKKISPIH